MIMHEPMLSQQHSLIFFRKTFPVKEFRRALCWRVIHQNYLWWRVRKHAIVCAYVRSCSCTVVPASRFNNLFAFSSAWTSPRRVMAESTWPSEGDDGFFSGMLERGAFSLRRNLRSCYYWTFYTWKSQQEACITEKNIKNSMCIPEHSEYYTSSLCTERDGHLLIKRKQVSSVRDVLPHQLLCKRDLPGRYSDPKHYHLHMKKFLFQWK